MWLQSLSAIMIAKEASYDKGYIIGHLSSLLIYYYIYTFFDKIGESKSGFYQNKTDLWERKREKELR